MFQIISDGGSDFTTQEAKQHKVDVVPFYITFDQETYLKEGIDISNDEYFKRLIAEKNLYPKTAQPSPQDYIDVYTPHLKAGYDVLVLTISSKLSGSYSSATIAAEMVKDEYPNRSICVVDSQSVTVGQGLILREIVRMRDAGYPLQDAVALTEQVRETTRIYITIDTLEYLKRGGRVGPTTALVGGILGLRPILQVVNGEVSQLDSVRGKKRAYQLIEEGLIESLSDVKDEISICVAHIMSEADAVQFKANTERALGIQIDIPVVNVGAAIGTHAGPGAMGFAYCRKYDTLKNVKDVVA